MMFRYDVINALLSIILLFNGALLLPLLRNIKNNVQTLVYAVNIVTILLWIITMMGYRSEGVYFETWLRALYVVAIFIGITYMHFTFFYPTTFRYAKVVSYCTVIAAFVVAYSVSLTDRIVVRGIITGYGEPQIIFGPWYLVYVLIILIPFTIGFARHLYLIYKKNTHISYLLLGYFISANVAFVTNLMLPWIGVFVLNWVGQFFTVLMVSLTTYSILKFNVMNIRFFAINVGVTLLLITTFSQIFFADSMRNLIVSGLVFLISSITSAYLVVLSKNERESLEHTVHLNTKIKKINADLAQANEQLTSLDRLKSEFVSLASHQLRSPLTVIKGYASTLRDGVVGELTPKQDDVVKHIYASAEGMASVVEDFLNVTKIEQGGMSYDFTYINVRDIVEALVGDMKVAAQEKHLLFTAAIEKVAPCITLADATKLRQVFLNLIDNSIKYTKEGFVHVSLSREKNSIIFSVSDSGLGLSDETKKNLFTKFSKGDAGRAHGGGSGLGLYLAEKIVKAHNGTITATSQGVDKGTTFTVVLAAQTEK